MRPHWFNYNNISSLSLGLIIKEMPSFTGAQRDVSYESIPGRSGDIIIDNNRYKNVELSYPCAILPQRGTVAQAAHAIRCALGANVGYFKLFDSSDSLYFRWASFTGAPEIEKNSEADAEIEIAFNCKPFRYAWAGLEKITLTSAGNIHNAEAFASLPYIKVTGSGNVTLTIGNKTHSFNIDDGYIEIDSELMNAYKGTTLKNNKMTTTEFPTLLPGNNAISWTGTVSSVEITPKWRTL